MDKYQNEQSDVCQKTAKVKEILAKSGDYAKSIYEFVSLIGKYVDDQTRTPDIVSQLINKIAVHEGQTVDDARTQRMDIH